MSSMDADIAPLMEKISTIAQTQVRDKLLPLLRRLDEDVLVSQYTQAEQARLYLSFAFLLASSLYALDKLNNGHGHSGHGGGGASNKKVLEYVQNAGVSTSLFDSHTGNNNTNRNVDLQVLLKLERITGYIRKLKEISELDSANSGNGGNQPANHSGKARKRGREEMESGEAVPHPSAGSPPATGNSAQEQDAHQQDQQGQQQQQQQERQPNPAGASEAAATAAAASSDGDSEMFSVLRLNVHSKLATETAEQLVGRAEEPIKRQLKKASH